MNDIHKAAGIIIKDRKLLVERSPGRGKHVFIAPGGKLLEGETHEQALVRELSEELSIVVGVADLELFSIDDAEAANHPGQKVVMRTYIVKSWKGEIIPDAEVEEIAWMTAADIGTVPIGSIFERKVMPALKKQGLID